MILDTINQSLQNLHFDFSKINKVVVFQHMSQQWFINLVIENHYFTNILLKNKQLQFFATPIYTFTNLTRFDAANENFLVYLSEAQIHHPVDRMNEFEIYDLNELEFELNKRKILA